MQPPDTSAVTAAWKVMLLVPGDAVDLFTDALRPFALSVAAFGGEAMDAEWTVEAYLETPPDPGPMAAAVALAASAADVAEPHIACLPLAPTDWLKDSLDTFQPVQVGRFFVYPSHYAEAIPAGSIAIRIDAATAFGSGEHGSTSGCLRVIDAIGGSFRPRRTLDLGCGSGILSIAVAKRWRAPVVAADIDPEAVRVSHENFVENGVARQTAAIESNGRMHRLLLESAPYDLILANILARPLIGLAPALRQYSAPGGFVVLSGLLVEQAQQVLGAYRQCGFVLRNRLVVEGWATLVLSR